MKQICCIDCVHCIDELNDDDYNTWFRYYCDAGSVISEIDDPNKVIDCPDFVQFIEDI